MANWQQREGTTMRFSHLSSAIVMACGLALTGCQTSTQAMPEQAANPQVMEQVSQLASLVAGAQYLRTHCGQTAVPDNDTLYSRATSLARQRNWNTHAAEFRQLPTLTTLRYHQLVEDTEPDASKCTRLSGVLSHFVSP
ncbi:type II secretion system pilot lipoprotein GspS [Mangrovibacter plantisponsor]|nr:type II secretion system pilot lipoprotein GspS [Mangrovibacter plantisponsor]